MKAQIKSQDKQQLNSNRAMVWEIFPRPRIVFQLSHLGGADSARPWEIMKNIYINKVNIL